MDQIKHLMTKSYVQLKPLIWNHNTNHSHSLYGVPQSLKEHRDNIWVACCYSSQ